MTNAIKTTVYYCPACEDEYEDYDSAIHCCRVKEEIKWKCDICCHLKDTEEEANECCDEEEAEI